MDIQTAVSECDMAQAILVALISYRNTPAPSDRVLQSLSFAASSSLNRAESAIQSDTITAPQFELVGYTSQSDLNDIKSGKAVIALTSQEKDEVPLYTLAQQSAVAPSTNDEPRYIIATDTDNDGNETGLWTICRQYQDGTTDALMDFHSRERAEHVLAVWKADLQSEQSTPAPLFTPCDDGMAIARRIQLAREKLGLTEATLASMLDLIPECITDWKEGNCPLEATYVIPLANALKCDPLWLLTGETTHQPPATPDHQSQHHYFGQPRSDASGRASHHEKIQSQV